MFQTAQLEGVPFIRSPHTPPVAPSPFHHLLASLGIELGYLSRLIYRRSRGLLIERMAAGVGTNELNEADVNLSFRDISQ